MARDKYGTGDDPYCYPGSNVLQNLMNIEDDEELAIAEVELTELAVEEIELDAPPYDLDYFQSLHQQVFEDIYEWAGEPRSIDMSKGTTRFCTCKRIAPEANKLFQQLAGENYYEDYEREAFVSAIAELYIELNMVHPFREGNGRVQRLLFEHIIINAGFEFDLEGITQQEWVAANIAGVSRDYGPMTALFDRCIGAQLND